VGNNFFFFPPVILCLSLWYIYRTRPDRRARERATKRQPDQTAATRAWKWQATSRPTDQAGNSSCSRRSSVTFRRAVLFEISYDKYLFLLKRTRCGVKPINGLWKIYGEFNHLYWQLRNHSERFCDYLRMSAENFDFLLRTESQRLLQQRKKYTQAISHDERLPVTIT